jgi:hypothetical protein
MDNLADILSEQLGFDQSFAKEAGQQLAALSANEHPAPSESLGEDTDVEEMQEETTQTITITCPDGVGPGDTIQLDTPNGHIDVEIPEGLEPGDEFDVEISVDKDEDDEDDEVRASILTVAFSHSSSRANHYRVVGESGGRRQESRR